MDLDHLAAQAPTIMLALEAHRVLDVPTANWFGIFPDATALSNTLRDARTGRVPQKWFSPLATKDSNPALRYRLGTYGIILIGRLCGVPIPKPEPAPLDRAEVVARWAVETVKTHGACLIRANVSKALRVSVAAHEQGWDLTGVTLMGGGEPPTPAKVRGITRTGARWVPNYFLTETGAIGFGCAQPADGNDIHFFKDMLAFIQTPVTVSGTETTANAFYFTTLLPTAPKLMLNVETDDDGVVEERSCGCPLEAYGFTDHLRHIRSFRKLTGEGVTLIGSEMIRILEEVLPMRFGGSPLDYQLLEEEDESGFTRLSLIVSPRIKIADEAMVINTVLDALRQSNGAADLAQAHWRQAKTLQVKRTEPIWTARGKFMPFYLTRRSDRSSGAGQT
jgi:hypothetical protein